MVAALDKFRGTITAERACAAVGNACWDLGHDCVEVPVGDGGEGTLDVLGNLLYLFATRAGMLSVAGVLSSLYPASTVLLARLVYGERLRPIQRLGLVVAVAGVGLVTST